MWEKIKIFLSRAGTFAYPYLKKALRAVTPAIETAAKAAVAIMAEKYKGRLNDRISKQQAHNDAFDFIVGNAGAYGIDLAAAGVNSAIDLAIKAAVEEAKPANGG